MRNEREWVDDLLRVLTTAMSIGVLLAITVLVLTWAARGGLFEVISIGELATLAALLIAWKLLLMARRRLQRTIPGPGFVTALGRPTAVLAPRQVQESDEELERIRRHEAGHAAVALALDFPLSMITTTPDGSSRARTVLLEHPLGTTNEVLWRRAIVCLAGASAEAQLPGGSIAAGCRSDAAEAFNLCTALALAGFKAGEAQTPLELLDLANERASELLDWHAQAVTEIAKELEKDPVVTGERAARIFTETHGESRPRDC